MNHDALVNALRQELAGYVRRGLPDRAKGVEEELRRLGCLTEATSPVEIVPSEPASTPPKPSTRVRKPAEAPKAPQAPKSTKRAK